MKTNHDPAGFLKEKLSEATQANPQFSLRAFAKKLGLSPGGLSQILARKTKLSTARAHEIAEKLKLEKSDRDYFLLLTEIQSAKSMAMKTALYERLQAFSPASQHSAFNLSVDQFRVISEWYGLAILHLVSTFGSKWTTDQIAKFFDLKKLEVESTLERLTRLEIIEGENGNWKRISGRLFIESGVPSEAIQNYYRGVLQKAEQSISEQTPKEKVIGTEVFAFDVGQLPEVKAATDRYLDQILEIAKSGKNKTQIYQVFVDCFRLSERNSK